MTEDTIYIARKPKRGGPLEVVAKVPRITPVPFQESRKRVIVTAPPSPRRESHRPALVFGLRDLHGRPVQVREHLRGGDRIKSHVRRPPKKGGIREIGKPPEEILVTAPGPRGTRRIVGVIAPLERFPKKSEEHEREQERKAIRALESLEAYARSSKPQNKSNGA